MSEFEAFDYLYRVILIGDSGVGKSNLIKRYTKNEFDESSQTTIGVDFSNRNLKIESKLVKAQIWDTAGQDRFQSISQAFYRGSVAALLVFDLTNKKTFENLEIWLKEIKNYADKDIRIMLVGNKCDLKNDRVIEIENADAYAKLNNMRYIETSALDTTNVEEAFSAIILEVFKTNVLNESLNEEYESFKKKIQLNHKEVDDGVINGCC